MIKKILIGIFLIFILLNIFPVVYAQSNNSTEDYKEPIRQVDSNFLIYFNYFGDREGLGLLFIAFFIMSILIRNDIIIMINLVFNLGIILDGLDLVMFNMGDLSLVLLFSSINLYLMYKNHQKEMK